MRTKTRFILAISLVLSLFLQTTALAVGSSASLLYKDADHIASWAIQDVEKASDLGIVQGSDGSFHPNDPVTRSAFTKMLVTALELELSHDFDPIFHDVSETDWFAPYVLTAYQHDLIKGYNHTFRPKDPISREEMAVIISRAFDLNNTSSNLPMKDKNEISSWAMASVTAVHAKGIITGFDHKFHPKLNASREMATVILMRAYATTEDKSTVSIDNALTLTSQYLLKSTPKPNTGSIGGEWLIFGLARGYAKVPASFYEEYIRIATTLIETEHAKPSRKWNLKVTDTQRLAIALAALGENIEDINGINLVDYTWNKANYMSDLPENQQVLGGRQGLNELCFGLIVIDLLPSDEPSSTPITRDEIIQTIVGDYALPNGGFSLSKQSKSLDVDITAMTITALAKYYQKSGYESVTMAIDQSLSILSNLQADDAGFGNPTANISGTLETASQVVISLCSLGYDPTQDARFIKQGNNLISYILSFQQENGSFSHTKGSATNQMATEQAYYALVAYDRFLKGKTALYDMS